MKFFREDVFEAKSEKNSERQERNIEIPSKGLELVNVKEEKKKNIGCNY